MIRCTKKVHPRKRKSKPEANLFRDFLRLAGGSPHAALMAGYRMATGDYILSLDDDGQAPIESVPQMIEALKESDLVFGAYAHKKHNIFRNLGSKVNDWMAEILLKKPKKLHVTSFFAMRRFIKDEILKYDNAFPYLLGLLLRATKNIVNVPVNHRERSGRVMVPVSEK